MRKWKISLSQFSIVWEKLSVGKKNTISQSAFLLVASCLPTFANITRSKITAVGQILLSAVHRSCPTRARPVLMLTEAKHFGGQALWSVCISFLPTLPLPSFLYLPLSYTFLISLPYSFFSAFTSSFVKSPILFHITITITIPISAPILREALWASNGKQTLLQLPCRAQALSNRNMQGPIENGKRVSFQVCTRTFRAKSAWHYYLKSPEET